MQTKFNKPLIMSEKDNEDFSNSIKCWICKKAYEEGEAKIKEHDHLSKYWKV